ncbi:hypothetical protein F53441_4064 [Fusarium austroafricanum]|uniref:Defect at low temperature protein 1 n=1 Tax=Fusarium austroafricanum TaxID=2364996 RepID=A0A8H4KNN1_9HYPO|nr:hypothetical protein F53441_4064 [Fusarium austroafricanum]
MASPESNRRLVASIVYRTLYLLLYVCLLGLLIATPGDAIHRSFQNRQLYNIWILIAAYVSAILVVSFVFFTRLYINKTDLAAIPKGWVPIEKGDLRSTVYKVIGLGLGRSASIAYESRPRLQTDNTTPDDETVETRVKLGFDGPSGPAEELVVVIPRRKPVWGDIEHYGWASPNAPDLPNLQYTTVFSELPDLIEAKALTLAPHDPTSETNPPLLDPDAVALLQRTANMSLRDYIVHLAGLGVLEMDATTIEFLSRYEYARFSNRPISNARFKELMHLFAEILRAMEPLDLDNLDDHTDTSSPSTTGDDDARSRLGTPHSNSTRSDAASISSSTRIRRQISTNTWNIYETAPNSDSAPAPTEPAADPESSIQVIGELSISYSTCHTARLYGSTLRAQSTRHDG